LSFSILEFKVRKAFVYSLRLSVPLLLLSFCLGGAKLEAQGRKERRDLQSRCGVVGMKMEQESKDLNMSELKDKLDESLASGDGQPNSIKKGQLMNTQIATVEFVEDVDAFMGRPENGSEAQIVLKRMEETYSRMKIIEANNVGTKRRLKNQIQELDKSLEMLEVLKKRKSESKEITNHFRLADHVYIKARIPPVEKIGLWLGAKVMLEYDLDEGEELLVSKKAKAESNLKATQDIIDNVREQITVTEVNMARIYNWDVKRRQAEKEKGKGGSGS